MTKVGEEMPHFNSAFRIPNSAFGMRSILHIDMNAFFASVEQRSNPALRGRPMAVIGSERRGVVLSPSYEARAYGVKTGMMYHEARALCRDIILVPASSGKYSHACEQLIPIWKSFTPLVELFSIDEAFLDVTGCEALFGDPVRIAIRIKERTWEETRLTCSVGIGPNKLLAKLGSDMQKPDGLVLILPDDVPEVMEDLPVKEICGIGPNLTRHLAAMGIHTCGELGRTPLRRLTARFGIIGERLRNMGLGIDNDPVAPLEEQEAEEAKSMGHSMTLAGDCADRAALERHILQLGERVGRRLRRGFYSGRTVSLVLRSSDFHTFSKQKRLRHAVSHGLDIYAAAMSIFRHIGLTQPVRLVGVSVSSLERNVAQVPLFEEERKRTFVAEAMDSINDRYGDFTVTWGTLAGREDHERVISPAWRPAGDRAY
jgi:DNA polymerase-4